MRQVEAGEIPQFSDRTPMRLYNFILVDTHKDRCKQKQ